MASVLDTCVCKVVKGENYNNLFEKHTMDFIHIITSQVVTEPERMATVDKLFGIQYVLKLEPTVFSMAERLSSQYKGGHWLFHSLSNGGVYMAPRGDTIFAVSCENGFEGNLSADALGIAACLYAYSHLSFREDALAAICADHYHHLRDFAMTHREARAILRATD